jgi:hypothetical protein
MYYSVSNGFFLLFFAGMFVFPLSKFALKLFFQRTPESKSNPGGLIVIETVFPMIGACLQHGCCFRTAQNSYSRFLQSP